MSNILEKKRRVITDTLAECRFNGKGDGEIARRILAKFFPQGTTDKDGFLKYIHEQREEFAKIALTYSVDDHLELRTKIDNLIIAYDQMAERVREIDSLRHYKDTTVGLWCTDRPDLVKDPQKLMFQLNYEKP